MTSPNQDPDPATTPGPAGPADTPDSGSMSGTSPDAQKAPNMGPVSGNRTPMLITLAVLAFFVIAIAVITGASFIPSD